MEPKPPRATMAYASTVNESPACGYTAKKLARMTPATATRAVPRPQATAYMRWGRMPTSMAASRSSAVAWRARPKSVRSIRR